MTIHQRFQSGPDALARYKNAIRHTLRKDYVRLNPALSIEDADEYMKTAERTWISKLTRIPSSVAENPEKGEL